ncbi:MAG TPA: hypothetical protein VGF84_23685 [Micromonosporaceae bacterium]|jgi:hypothetical protein
MGAVSWDYLVPYQADAAAAIADLHAARLAAGEITRSILDIAEVGDGDPYAGFLGHTYAVTEKEARVTFGTTAPTIEDLERWGGVGAPELQSLIPAQGVGRHLVLHTDDSPSHILFWGCTGE